MQMTVSIGDVIQMATTIIVIATAFFRLRERLVVLETKVTDLWDRRTTGRR